MIEDSNGIYWFSTGEGLAKYDGKNFTIFLVGEDFNSNVITKLLIDRKNVFWVGTWNGVFKFDGEAFYPFSVPYPEVDTKINEDTKYWVYIPTHLTPPIRFDLTPYSDGSAPPNINNFPEGLPPLNKCG